MTSVGLVGDGRAIVLLSCYFLPPDANLDVWDYTTFFVSEAALWQVQRDQERPYAEGTGALPMCKWPHSRDLSAAFYAAYGFTGAFGRNLCKFTFPQRRRNLRKSLLDHKTYTGVKRAKKWLR